MQYPHSCGPIIIHRRIGGFGGDDAGAGVDDCATNDDELFPFAAVVDALSKVVVAALVVRRWVTASVCCDCC